MWQVIYKRNNKELKSREVSYGQALCAFFMFDDAVAIEGGIFNRRKIPYKWEEKDADEIWVF